MTTTAANPWLQWQQSWMNEGMANLQRLSHLSGLWSKRISQKDRFIYRFDDQSIYIFAIGGHYDQT